MQLRTPKHIQDEIDCLLDELMLGQDSFNEYTEDREAMLKNTTYNVRKEIAFFKRTEYYIEEIRSYTFQGTLATSRADRYFIEQTTNKTFKTHEL